MRRSDGLNILYENIPQVEKQAVGRRIETLMKNTDIRPSDIAQLMHISVQAVAKWTNGITIPDLQHLVEVSYIFDTSVDYLLIGNVPEEEKSEVHQRLWQTLLQSEIQ